MYLQKLDIQGFKSFASRVSLEFPSANGHGKGITAVVGPNGSGKSNISDAVRWVLGEQSMKTLRGKKSEDVIFFGSDKKARVGMAEVSLYLNNEDSATAIDMPEIVITRRLYRSGESEYLLNNKKVRLSDIQILLAKANFGQRTYSVIGQGMVDHFLVASQAERKEFFDEAAGIKEFQIKKNQTLNQLARAQENLSQTDITLQELGPRYRSLKRMVARLEQRDEVEKSLKTLQLDYYRWRYQDIAKHWQTSHQQSTTLAKQLDDKKKELTTIQNTLNSLEQKETDDSAFANLQQQFNNLLEDKKKLQNRQMELEREITKAQAQISADFIPLPADEVARELESFINEQQNIADSLVADKIEEIKKSLKNLIGRVEALLKKVKRPEAKKTEVDPNYKKELTAIEEQLAKLDTDIKKIQVSIADFHRHQDQQKGQFFDLQRQFAAKQGEINQLSLQHNEANIELAKLETKKEDLENEIAREISEANISTDIAKTASTLNPDQLDETYNKIQSTKHQLELIGGIDEESVKEYQEIGTRFEFLNEQHQDLTKAIADLQKIIEQLDAEIHDRFDLTFKNINEKFGEYFQVLFGGGKASLEKLMIATDSEDDADDDNDDTKTTRTVSYGGVDIKACPPGKKISSLATLSGGERAMTAIALICAIIACNPSPFVVLDEVDAALDEANSDRFSSILEKLSTATQFIVVTHNRATMAKANILYGVTMGGDGASTLLSVKLEEGQQWAK